LRLAPLGNVASGMQNNAMTKEEYEIEGTLQTLGVSLDYEQARKQELLKKYSRAKYLDVTLDPGFKRLLKNEAAMVSFLNAILHSEDKIESVTFKDSEFDVHATDLLRLRLDINAQTQSGKSIDIEMQKSSVRPFVERVILQESAFLCIEKKAFDAEIKKKYPLNDPKDVAEREKRRYEIPHVYTVWICNFAINSDENYRDVWRIYSENSIAKNAPQPVTEKIKYIIVNLVNFTKTAEELETIEDKWLYLLKHAGSSDKLPTFNDEVLDDAVARITVDPGKDKELLEAQVACTMSIDEQIGRIVLAHQEGREEERKKQEEERRNLIKENLQKGYAANMIADFLKIPLSQVLEIQQELRNA